MSQVMKPHDQLEDFHSAARRVAARAQRWSAKNELTGALEAVIALDGADLDQQEQLLKSARGALKRFEEAVRGS